MILQQGPLIHIGIAIIANSIAAVFFYFIGRRDERVKLLAHRPSSK